LARPWEPEPTTARAKIDEFGRLLYGKTQQTDCSVVERVGQIAKGRGVTPAQIALAWLLHKPGVTSPIVGATKLNHLEDAAAALTVTLSPQEILSLEEPYVTHSVVGFS
jgi:aryl-alcohol dehydrogenase-like predicted oxidoreductase